MLVTIISWIISSAELKATHNGTGNPPFRNGGDGAHDMLSGVWCSDDEGGGALEEGGNC